MDSEVSHCQVKGDLVSMGLLLVMCVTVGLVQSDAPQTACGTKAVPPRSYRGSWDMRWGEWLWAPASASVRVASFISVLMLGIQ